MSCLSVRLRFRWFWLLVILNAGATSARSETHLLVTTRQSAETTQNGASPAKTPSPLGTIKSISGNTLVLTKDNGSDVSVALQDSTKIVRVAPGQKDLKDAQPLQLSDLQVGDRILVRGNPGEDDKKFVASSVIAMKKAEIADKQTRERDEWQKSGVGGLVNTVDADGGVISITTPSLRDKKTIMVHISPQTVLRRYAPGSVRFDDARTAPLDQIKPGDQLRARGTKNANSTELAAEDVVSGSFRNISGTVSSLDSAQQTITVFDLITKKPVTVKIAPDSQLRKLPVEMAQRIAQRLNGSSASAGSDSAVAASSRAASPTAKDPAAPNARPSGADNTGRERTDQVNGARGGRGFGGPGGQGGAPDLQQMINRMPSATISDLHQADAVMLVATPGSGNSVTAITLLAGVEPILQGAPNSSAATILSPWSLNSAPNGEAGTP
jgi:hypothetical protein